MTQTLTIGLVFLLILTQTPLNLADDDVRSQVQALLDENPQISEEQRTQIEAALAEASAPNEVVSKRRSRIPEELRPQYEAAIAAQSTKAKTNDALRMAAVADVADVVENDDKVSAAVADSLKGNSEMKINKRNKHGNVTPAMAKLCSGIYVVTWAEVIKENERSDIKFQMFDRENKPILHKEETANLFEGHNINPEIVSFPDGSFIITWEDRKHNRIMARKFVGEGLGTFPFVVRASSKATVSLPKIAVFQGESYSNYIITWLETDSQGTHLYSRILNTYFDNDDINPAINKIVTKDDIGAHDVTTLANGKDYVVTYTTPSGNAEFIMCDDRQTCDAPVWVTNDATLGSIVIAALPLGGFVIAYVVFDGCACMKIYNSDGTGGTTEYRIDPGDIFTSGSVSTVDRIDVFENGNFVITVTALQNGQTDVFSRIFSSADNAFQEQLQIDRSETIGADSSVLAFSGKFVVTWVNYGEELTEKSNIFMKSFCLSNYGCGEDSPTCDIASYSCFRCSKDEPCVSATDKCNLKTGRCGQCITSKDCGQTQSCTNMGNCVEKTQCAALRNPFWKLRNV